jgi:hypothetical protein
MYEKYYENGQLQKYSNYYNGKLVDGDCIERVENNHDNFNKKRTCDDSDQNHDSDDGVDRKQKKNKSYQIRIYDNCCLIYCQNN